MMVQQDFFALPKEYALAYCVAGDLEASLGISTVFRKRYGGIQELELQKPAVGKTLHLRRHGQHFLYLVTKDRPQQKATYQALWESLILLRTHLGLLGVRKLGIPKLGCRYDELDLKIVRPMLEAVYEGTGIEVGSAYSTRGEIEKPIAPRELIQRIQFSVTGLPADRRFANCRRKCTRESLLRETVLEGGDRTLSMRERAVARVHS